jgi:hypothetical protein
VFHDSPFTEPIPGYGGCDVTVTPANYMTTLGQVNDPTKRVFCVKPGDYRNFGRVLLTLDGTQANRRFLRLDVSDGKRNAVQRSERAIFESVMILRARWWVVQGLTIQPRTTATEWFMTIWGGDFNIVDGNLIDGVEHVKQASQDAVVIAGYQGNPATYNTVQGNVVRRGNQTRKAGDYEGILVAWANSTGENNDYNKIVDNEVYDWGSGVSVGAYTEDCSEPGVQNGTVIDGNDVYITPAKYVDCNTGAVTPTGECACAEEGLSQKGVPSVWTRMTNNRVWGYRPTRSPSTCGGSGGNGQGITAGNKCSARVFVSNNVVQDCTQGIVPNNNWIVTGNLIADIRMSNDNPYSSVALFPVPTGSGSYLEFNTLVNVDAAYEDQSSSTDTRCNVVINAGSARGAGDPRNATNWTYYNYVYGSSSQNWTSNNEFFATAAQSNNQEYCYWRKRWTAPERVCIPYGSSTAAGPHVGAAGSCSQDIGAPFGVDMVSYPTTRPCADGLDNDGDVRRDLADLGCADANAPKEAPACQNGIDDDGDGQVDYDGGESALGALLSLRDTACTGPAWDHEAGSNCGLGAELAGVLWLVRRRKA